MMVGQLFYNPRYDKDRFGFIHVVSTKNNNNKVLFIMVGGQGVVQCGVQQRRSKEVEGVLHLSIPEDMEWINGEDVNNSVAMRLMAKNWQQYL